MLRTFGCSSLTKIIFHFIQIEAHYVPVLCLLQQIAAIPLIRSCQSVRSSIMDLPLSVQATKSILDFDFSNKAIVNDGKYFILLTCGLLLITCKIIYLKYNISSAKKSSACLLNFFHRLRRIFSSLLNISPRKPYITTFSDIKRQQSKVSGYRIRLGNSCAHLPNVAIETSDV